MLCVQVLVMRWLVLLDTYVTSVKLKAPFPFLQSGLWQACKFIVSHLHSCFDYINWCVPKHTCGSSHSTNHKSPDVANVLGRVSILEIVFQVCVDKEPNSLVGALFQDGGCQTLIGASYP